MPLHNYIDSSPRTHHRSCKNARNNNKSSESLSASDDITWSAASDSETL